MGLLSDWWRRRKAARATTAGLFADNWFDATVARVPRLRRLAAAEQARLRQLAREFAADKDIVGVRGLEVDTAMRTRIATIGAWPALHLGYAALEGWSQLIVYAEAFRAQRKERDEKTGVVHEYEQSLAGEAWGAGPVVLSWQDLVDDIDHPQDRSNVLIHELAHKIDGLDGAVDGRPPLHPWMSAQRWTEVFAAAFDDLNARLDRHEYSAIDPYAAENPEEFFAVTSELHFVAPDLLSGAYPEVAEQLAQFYNGKPAAGDARG